MSSGLSLAFIEHKPLAAARALNALPIADAAAYLESIPARYATRVIGRISAWSASKLVLSMSPTEGAAILRALPYLDSVAILRLMRPTERDPLLAELPRRLRKDLEVTMAYPADTVGGQMCVDIVTLKPNHTVADARDALSKATTTNADTLFVVDAGRRYVGSIPTHTLFRYAEETLISDLALVKARPLLARQSLATAAGLDAWNESQNLPVLGRRRHLVGSLPIKQVLIDNHPSARPGTTVNTLAGAYLASASSLLALFSNNQATSSIDPELAS